jgi:predicted unusual protein kinase regulating ubiquinone biosynthesis (AarF/ABC1/UbiB family)
VADDRAIRALMAAGLKIARSTSSGRLAFAQANALVDPEALPPALRERVVEELGAAAAAVSPISPKDVAKALQKAWGSAPEKLLQELDLEHPIAVTAGAQVHRGVHDGAEVAVKLLRPGLAESVRADLALLDTLSAPARRAFPAIDATRLIREVRERILDELDLEHGAHAQRAAARALRRDGQLHVPAVVADLTHNDVIVSALVPGPTLAAGIPAGRDAGETARQILRFFAGAPRAIGLVHADADPANILFTDGGIAVVDFAATGPIARELLDAALDALQALRAGDAETFAAVVVDRLGVLPDAASATKAMGVLREIGADLLTGPARLDAAALVALNARAEQRSDVLLSLGVGASIAPEHLWPLRMVATLVPTLARLGVTADWVADGIAFARNGW